MNFKISIKMKLIMFYHHASYMLWYIRLNRMNSRQVTKDLKSLSLKLYFHSELKYMIET